MVTLDDEDRSIMIFHPTNVVLLNMRCGGKVDLKNQGLGYHTMPQKGIKIELKLTISISLALLNL
jgi:hypothetical protein